MIEIKTLEVPNGSCLALEVPNGSCLALEVPNGSCLALEVRAKRRSSLAAARLCLASEDIMISGCAVVFGWIIIDRIGSFFKNSASH